MLDNMPEKQTAGGSINNINVEGDNNNIALFGAPGESFEGMLQNAKRQYKILVCLPSPTKVQHQWHNFYTELLAKLKSKGFEIVLAGNAVPRNDDEPIYKAEQRHLMDRNCHALLVLACDHVTLSQLTHLTDAALGQGKPSKNIVAIPDADIINGEQYFEEGAIKTIQATGMIFSPPLCQSQNAKNIDEIVKHFVLLRNIIL